MRVSRFLIMCCGQEREEINGGVQQILNQVQDIKRETEKDLYQRMSCSTIYFVICTSFSPFPPRSFALSYFVLYYSLCLASHAAADGACRRVMSNPLVLPPKFCGVLRHLSRGGIGQARRVNLLGNHTCRQLYARMDGWNAGFGAQRSGT